MKSENVPVTQDLKANPVLRAERLGATTIAESGMS